MPSSGSGSVLNHLREELAKRGALPAHPRYRTPRHARHISGANDCLFVFSSRHDCLLPCICCGPDPAVASGYADLHRRRYDPNGGEVRRYGHPVPGTLSLVVTRVIRDVAEDVYLTQAELARRSGVPQSTISRAYHERQAFTIDQLDALCRALGVSVAAVIAEAQRRFRKGE